MIIIIIVMNIIIVGDGGGGGGGGYFRHCQIIDGYYALQQQKTDGTDSGSTKPNSILGFANTTRG
ncbi:hypothetical protein QR98_0083740 [Sarcoptes scabiei]|uniref:Uncharacterized protein n=1 Tax=Sarcoptes scabiei TaxID=52283 RepID=A0A132AG88_SARSC|nr:hypothetical protein QR98_0083740 [Sarcoptes scabiei]